MPSQAPATVADPLVKHVLSVVRSPSVRPGEFLGTEVGLAEDFGISRTSARKALDTLVERGVIERRRGAGVFARQPHLASNVIQVVVPALDREENGRLVRGIQDQAREAGCTVQVLDAQGDTETTLELLNQLGDGPARGAIFRSPHNPRFIDALIDLRRHTFPFVTVDVELQHSRTSSVRVDNYDAGRQAAGHLLELGHRRFGMIASMVAETNCARWDGVRDRVLDAGLHFERGWVRDLSDADPLGDWRPMIEAATDDLIEAQPGPTAIFYNDDRAAAIGLRYLRGRGVRVPEDVSIVGSGNSSLADLLDPTLATLDEHVERQGREAMDILFKLMNDPDAEPEHRVLPMPWVAGQSVGPAPCTDSPGCFLSDDASNAPSLPAG